MSPPENAISAPRIMSLTYGLYCGGKCSAYLVDVVDLAMPLNILMILGIFDIILMTAKSI